MSKTTKDIIGQSALDAFSQKGFSQTSMDLIAKNAGVAKGTLYYNFANKEELFIYVLQQGIHQLTEILSETLSKYKDHPQKWQYVIEAHLDFFEKNRSFFHLMIQNMWKENVLNKISLHELLGNYFKVFDSAVKESQESGQLSKKLDITALTGSIIGLITIPAARALFHKQPIDNPKLVYTVIQFLDQRITNQREENLYSEQEKMDD